MNIRPCWLNIIRPLFGLQGAVLEEDCEVATTTWHSLMWFFCPNHFSKLQAVSNTYGVHREIETRDFKGSILYKLLSKFLNFVYLSSI